MIARGQRFAAGAVLLAVAFALVGSPSSASADVGASHGPVTVVDAGTGDPIAEGVSTTPFSVELPVGAACPGDSIDNYRVQSFVVPASVDPGTLIYQGVRPGEKDGSARYWALYEVNSNTFMNRPTDVAAEEGGEGTIINIPAFDYAVFDPGMVPTGPARLGIACSLFGETTRYWSTDIEIIAEADDPAGISWRVSEPPAEAADGSRLPIIAGAIAVVAIGGTVAVRRRTAARQQVTS